MNDLAGVEFRDCLADRANAAASSTGKAAVEVFSARQGGNLGTEGSVNFLAGYSHKEPRLKKVKK
jgi:hypothetical protein